MPITVNCACGKEYPVKDEFAGQRVKCPDCGQILTIPEAPAEAVVEEITAEPQEVEDLEVAEAGAEEVPEEVEEEIEEEEAPPKKKGKSMMFAVLGCGCLLLFLGTGALGGVGGLGYYLGWFADYGFAWDDSGSTDKDKDKDKGKPADAPKDGQQNPPKDDPQDPPKPKRRPKPPEEEGQWKGHQASILTVRFPTFDTKSVISVAGGMEKNLADNTIDLAPDNSVRFWSVDGTKIKVLDQFPDGISTAAISPDGKFAALVYPGKTTGDVWTKGSDNVIHVWDLTTKQEIAKLQGHTDAVLCLAFNANGQRLLSGGRDNSVRLWKIATQMQENVFLGHTGAVTGVAFAPGRSEGVSCGDDGNVKLWNLEADQAANPFIRDFRGHTDKVGAVAFSEDGSKLLTGGGDADPDIRLWNVADGTEILHFKGHTRKVTCLVFSRDGRRALSGSADKIVRLWQVSTGQELAKYGESTDTVNTVAFFPDGKRALSGGDDKKLHVSFLPPDVAEIIVKLDDPDQKVRQQAVHDLAKFGDEAKSAVPALVKCLNSSDNMFRSEVLGLLKKLGFQPTRNDVPLLTMLVADKTFTEGRQFALEALAPLGPDAKPALQPVLAALKEPDAGMKRRAIVVLGQIGPDIRDEVFVQLIDFLRNSDPELVKAASEALPKLGKPDKDQIAPLGRFLADSNANVRRYAVAAVSDLGPAAESVLPQLIEMVKNDIQPELRKAAMTALLKVKPKDPATVEVLAAVIKKNDDTPVSLHALAVLTQIGPSGGALPGLLAGLEQRDKDIQKAAEEAFDKAVFDKGQVKALATAIRLHNNAKIRTKLVDSLAKLGPDGGDAAEELGLVVKESDGELRLKAIKTLAELGPEGKKAAPELIALMDNKLEKDEGVRIEAAIALTRMNATEAKQGIPILVKGLLVTDLMDAKQLERQDRVQKILIQIGTPAADPLAKTLGPTGDFYNSKTTTPAGMAAAEARRRVIAILKEMGPKANTGRVLLELANTQKEDPDGKVRELAAEARKVIQK